MGHRRMGIGAAAGRLGGILTALAVHVIHLLGLLIPGLEVRITQRPGRRAAVEVGEFLEVLLAQTEVGGAVHLGGAADEVMATGLEGLAVFVEPGILRDVAVLLEHRVGIPVLRFLGQPVAPLQHQHLQTCGSQMAGQGAATGPTADDHHVEVGAVGHLQLGRFRQGRGVEARTGDRGGNGSGAGGRGAHDGGGERVIAGRRATKQGV